MTKEEEQENNVLAKEIESWNSFEYSLREEDSILFNKMLNECQKEEEYSKASDAKGKNTSSESLFMTLIFQQQKIINKLIDNISICKANKNNLKIEHTGVCNNILMRFKYYDYGAGGGDNNCNKN